MFKMCNKFIGILLCAGIAAGAFPAAAVCASSDFSDQLDALIAENDGEYIESIELTIGEAAISVNGVEKELEVAPENSKDTNYNTMLPARAVIEALGGEASYDSGDIVLEKDDVTMTLQIGNPEIKIENSVGTDTITAETAPKDVNNGNTVIPLRVVSENFGATVMWDEIKQKVTIVPEYQTKRIIVKSSGRSLNFSRYQDFIKKVIEDGEGAYIVQFEDFVSEATIKDYYCEQIKKWNGVEYAVPDIALFGASNRNGEGEDVDENDYKECAYKSLNDVGIPQYIENAANNGTSFRDVKIGVMEPRAFKDHHDFNGRLTINNVESRDGITDVNHATLDASIIDRALKKLDDKYSIYGYGGATVAQLGTQIKDAVSDGCSVINISQQVPGGTKLENVRPVRDVIRENNDKLFVVSAGNEDQNVSKGSDLYGLSGALSQGNDNVISVAAVDDSNFSYEEGKAYCSSNWGYMVDIAAPGVDIVGYGYNGGYYRLSGTSQAAPHVAAAAAAIYAMESGLTGSYVKQILKEKCTYVPDGWNTRENSENYYGAGILMMPNSRQDKPDKDETGYEWSKSSFELEVGDTDNIKLYKTYSDGSREDVTAQADLYSTDPAVVTVSSDGKLKAIGAGTAKITMSMGASGIKLPSPVTVKVTSSKQDDKDDENDKDNKDNKDDKDDKAETGYEWSKSSFELEVGDTDNIKLYKTYSDGSREDVTSKADLYSTDPAVVTVSSSGKLKAIGAGKAKITMSAGASGINMPRPVTVTVTNSQQNEDDEDDVYETGYEWSKSSFELEVGDTDNIKLYKTYSDGSREDVTSKADLYSTDPAVVTVSSSGKLKAIGAGTTKITMSVGASGVNMPRPVTVTVKSSEPEVSSMTYGDLNGDGKLSSKDISLLNSFIDGSRIPTAEQKTAGDLDGNGVLNSTDVNLLKERVLLGSETPFPVEN